MRVFVSCQNDFLLDIISPLHQAANCRIDVSVYECGQLGSCSVHAKTRSCQHQDDADDNR